MISEPSHMIKGGYQPPSSTNEKISPTSFPVGGSPVVADEDAQKILDEAGIDIERRVRILNQLDPNGGGFGLLLTFSMRMAEVALSICSAVAIRLAAMVAALFGFNNTKLANRGVGPWVARSAGWRQKQRRKLARRTA